MKKKGKNSMKRRIALMLAFVMIMSLTACSGKKDSGEQSADAPAKAPAEEAQDPSEETGEKEGLTFAIVPKQAGNEYHEVIATGFNEACAELGITPIVQYPEDTSAEAQSTVINNLIAQKVDGIAIGANDPEALEGAIKTARDQGIVVVTFDSDTKGSQVFVNQASNEAVAQVLVDSILDMTGGEGEFAVLSATSTATNQNAWIAAMENLIASDDKYAKLEWVTTVYGDDEDQKSYDETESLMTNYPDLKVICSPTCVGYLAACKAVMNANSEIKVAGLGMPSWSLGYVGEGTCSEYMYLWNPVEIGSTTVYTMKALKDGLTTGAEGESYTADNGKEYTVTPSDESLGIYSTQVIVGDPFRFDGSNIDEWAAKF